MSRKKMVLKAELRRELRELRAAAREAIAVLKASDPEGHRARIFAGLPEDEAVLALCEQHGFGAVMDSAARQWRQRDPKGAFTTGACPPTIQHALKMLGAALRQANEPRGPRE